MYGSHLNNKYGNIRTYKYLLDLGGDSLQMFVGNNKSWNGKNILDNDCEMSTKYINDNDINLIVHSPYLINLARSENNDIYKKSIQRLKCDLINTSKLGGKGLVLHMGKNTEKITFKEACVNMMNGIESVLNDNKVKTQLEINPTSILIENVAGQGTEMGHKIEDFAYFMNLIDNNVNIDNRKIGICLDTCHLFAAGQYDISQIEEVDKFRNDFERLIGWNKIKIFHFNDSKTEFGSRKDRHEDIGFGKIGENGLKRIIKYACENDQPLIMECPFSEENNTDREKSMKLLKEWIDSQQ